MKLTLSKIRQDPAHHIRVQKVSIEEIGGGFLLTAHNSKGKEKVYCRSLGSAFGLAVVAFDPPTDKIGILEQDDPVGTVSFHGDAIDIEVSNA